MWQVAVLLIRYNIRFFVLSYFHETSFQLIPAEQYESHKRPALSPLFSSHGQDTSTTAQLHLALPATSSQQEISADKQQDTTDSPRQSRPRAPAPTIIINYYWSDMMNILLSIFGEQY